MQKEPSDRYLTFPNIITGFRILGVPILFWMLLREHWFSFWLFAILVFSDFLDGRVARTFGSVSKLGITLDPIADKLMTVPLLIFFWHRGMLDYKPVLLLVGREFIVTYFRGMAAAYHVLTPALVWGKAKGVFEYVALLMLMWQFPQAPLVGLAWWVVWMAVLLALISLFHYMLVWGFVLDYCMWAIERVIRFFKLVIGLFR